jgi:hypothetical protein
MNCIYAAASSAMNRDPRGLHTKQYSRGFVVAT